MNDREFAAALRDRDAILILSHLRPDGDTLGSGAALCSALRRMGKTAYLFPNPETTARYLPYVAQFFAPADFVPACVVAVDIATPNLFPQGFSGAVDLCIDHHPSNALYAGDTLLHAEKSACGEAVLDVIELLTGSVTEQEANLLYIAVTTDTGCFQYANTNAATLRAAARLLELGADNRKISMDFFRKISRARMALVGQIYSGMRFFRGGQVAIAVVTRALIDSVHATEDDCDDIAGLPGRAEGVVVSVTIRELLDELYERYDTPGFIEDDPISVPHGFTRREDIEIAGFLAATIAWGNRRSIVRNGRKLMELMDRSPYDFTMNASRNELLPLLDFVHRTFNGGDCIDFIGALRGICLRDGSLGGYFEREYAETGDLRTVLSRFRTAFWSADHRPRAEKHLSSIDRGASCKRLCMYLKWMVRDDGRGVDFGLWKSIPPAALYLPLDVHTGHMGRALGLLARKQNDWKAVEEITASLRMLDASDPVKYDFALFGAGIDGFLK